MLIIRLYFASKLSNDRILTIKKLFNFEETRINLSRIEDGTMGGFLENDHMFFVMI